MRAAGVLALVLALVAGAARAAEGCDRPRAEASDAAENAASLTTLPWAPFGRAEVGWEIYAPQVAASLGTGYAPATPGFARAVARWRRRHRLGAGGALDTEALQQLKAGWQAARPFTAQPEHACPEPPDLIRLEAAAPEESDGGKIILLRPQALIAYRRMVAAARAEVPEAAADPERLMLFSGFREPAYDAGRCATEGNCQGLTRAACSPHRTGWAIDLFLGAAPGFDVDSTADANRLWQSRTATYRWLVRHAGKYGFVNYVFEPWHWEWVDPSPAGRRRGPRAQRVGG